MASPAVSVGTGSTIVFGTSGFSAQIVDIVSLPELMRESLPTNQMSSVKWESSLPAKLTDPGILELVVHFNPDTKVVDTATSPMEVASETITVSIAGAATTKATWAFSGFMFEYFPTIPFEGIMTANVKVKVTSAITFTAGT